MSILIFIFILSFLVIIHEFGHFLTARLFRIKIEEFGIGLPPKVTTLFVWKKIPFTLNALPLGGFVRMEGEDGNAGGTQHEHSSAHTDFPFYTRPAWQRLIVILAGATVNFLFGIVAFSILFSILGVPEYLPHPKIAFIAEQSPAQKSGMKVGDEIITLISPDKKSSSVASIDSFIQEVKTYKGKTITVEVRREGEIKTLPVLVRTDAQIPEGEGAIGVALEQTIIHHYPWYITPIKATVVGVQQSIDFALTIVSSLRAMVSDIVFRGTVPKDVAGPVGIAYQANKESLFTRGPLFILNFAALLSINLAIMNVLPIPALDGGRAFFILLEKIFPRRIRGKIEHAMNTAGFVLLLALILLITVKDVWIIIQDRL
jgi:regulator of sigma E protease